MSWGSLFGGLAGWFSSSSEKPTPPAGEPPPEGPGNWRPFDGGFDKIPKGRAAMIAAYGELNQTYGSDGSVKVSSAWERANMVLVRGMAGIPGGKIYTHRKVEPYLREAVRRSMIAAPGYTIARLGCFNPRHQRHDKTRPLSDHSWGIAFDVDSENNAGYYPRPGEDLTPWGTRWMEIWPKGMPQEFVAAWMSVGFEWGGLWKDYADTMHMSLRLV